MLYSIQYPLKKIIKYFPMRIISGMRPTGKLHLGHYYGVIKSWIELQEKEETFFFIADWHALTTSYKDVNELEKNIKELMVDWLSLGLDPKKSVLFRQSHVKQHAELYLLLGMITPKSWLEWNPTYKDMKYNLLKIQDLEIQFRGGIRDAVRQFINMLPYKVEDFEGFEEHLMDSLAENLVEALFNGLIEKEMLQKINVSKREFYETDTYGFLGYPVLQSADILIYKAEGVPVGEDQLPHIEMTREIARRFNHLYGNTFPEPKALLTETPKIPGTDGRKMSKSYGNAIFFSDENKEIEEKILKMFTDPQKLRKNDPGRPDICAVFTYHKIMNPNKDEVEEIYRDCKEGKLGCVECKRKLLPHVISVIEPVRERRKTIAKDIGTIHDVFEEGSKKAREIAERTMEEVREKMHIK